MIWWLWFGWWKLSDCFRHLHWLNLHLDLARIFGGRQPGSMNTRALHIIILLNKVCRPCGNMAKGGKDGKVGIFIENIYVYTYIYIYLFIFICCLYLFIYIYVFTFIYLFIYLFICVCVNVFILCMHMLSYLYMFYIYICVCVIYIHIEMNTEFEKFHVFPQAPPRRRQVPWDQLRLANPAATWPWENRDWIRIGLRFRENTTVNGLV